MPTICIFGDSITRGAGDSEHGGWAGLVRMEMEHGVDPDPVYVLGVNGDATGELLERFEVEARAREPEQIIFAIGANDAQVFIADGSARTPIPVFYDNLKRLTEIAQTFTKQIVFVGLTSIDESRTNPVPWRPDVALNNETRSIYNAAIQEHCAREGVKFIDVSDVLVADDLGDGVHPTPEGYRKMFERIIQHV